MKVKVKYKRCDQTVIEILTCFSCLFRDGFSHLMCMASFNFNLKEKEAELIVLKESGLLSNLQFKCSLRLSFPLRMVWRKTIFLCFSSFFHKTWLIPLKLLIIKVSVGVWLLVSNFEGFTKKPTFLKNGYFCMALFISTTTWQFFSKFGFSKSLMIDLQNCVSVFWIFALILSYGMAKLFFT